MEIRPIEQKDFIQLYELIERNRNRLITYFPKTLEAVTDKASAQKFVLQKMRQAQKREFYFFVLTIPETDFLLGCIMVKNIDWSVPKCEHAYFVDEEYEGKGLLTKALEGVIDFSFRELGMEKIYLSINPLNEGSRRVALKNGFVQEGLLRKEFRNGKGELIDVEYYGLVRNNES